MPPERLPRPFRAGGGAAAAGGGFSPSADATAGGAVAVAVTASRTAGSAAAAAADDDDDPPVGEMGRRIQQMLREWIAFRGAGKRGEDCPRREGGGWGRTRS